MAGLGVIARTVHLPLLQRPCGPVRGRSRSATSPPRGWPSSATGTASIRRRRYTDAARCWSTGGYDAVLLATSGSHGELAALALRSGLPVLCEKPLAYTLAEADRLTELSGGRRR